MRYKVKECEREEQQEKEGFDRKRQKERRRVEMRSQGGLGEPVPYGHRLRVDGRRSAADSGNTM